jgi:hypothetical protein
MTPLESWLIVAALVLLAVFITAGIRKTFEVYDKMQRHIDGD